MGTSARSSRHDAPAVGVSAWRDHPGTSEPPLRILVSGSTGLIGSALTPLLTARGHQVVRLSRSRQPGGGQRSGSGACRPGDGREGTIADAIQWNPHEGSIDEASLEGLDAVVHLAAESIAAGRWSAGKKKRILESRVRGTRLLCEALAMRTRRPRVLISASATGFYGDRGATAVDEESPSGSGFLADVCRQWEAATHPAEAAGIRVVKLRTAVVLSPAGGALGKMLIPFKLGAGGRFGDGRQFMSWIAIDDLVRLILHALTRETLSGPLNAASPNPVTNREFARTLGRVLRRPAALAVPAWALRLVLGEMARETILSGAKVVPRRALESGFDFRHPDLEGALRHLFGRMMTS